jgi:hypothetical protein
MAQPDITSLMAQPDRSSIDIGDTKQQSSSIYKRSNEATYNEMMTKKKQIQISSLFSQGD